MYWFLTRSHSGWRTKVCIISDLENALPDCSYDIVFAKWFQWKVHTRNISTTVFSIYIKSVTLYYFKCSQGKLKLKALSKDTKDTIECSVFLWQYRCMFSNDLAVFSHEAKLVKVELLTQIFVDVKTTLTFDIWHLNFCFRWALNSLVPCLRNADFFLIF